MNDDSNSTPATTRSITILASLPYTFRDPRCCNAFSAELWEGPSHSHDNDDYLLTLTHSVDCEVWRYIQ